VRKTNPHPGKPDQPKEIRSSDQLDAEDEELQQEYADVEEYRQSGYSAAAELHVAQDADMEAEERDAVLSISDLPAGTISRAARPATSDTGAEDDEQFLTITQEDFDRQEELDGEPPRVEDDDAYASEDPHAPKAKDKKVSSCCRSKTC
jgi:hypothetical protein